MLNLLVNDRLRDQKAEKLSNQPPRCWYITESWFNVEVLQKVGNTYLRGALGVCEYIQPLPLLDEGTGAADEESLKPR